MSENHNGAESGLSRRRMLATAAMAAGAGAVALPSGALAADSRQDSRARIVTASMPEVGAQDVQGSGFTYRHYWGQFRSYLNAQLTWGGFTPDTRVFVAVSEGFPNGQKSFGDARFLLYNVSPVSGAVWIRMHIDWPAPLHVLVDYLIVNP
jgi:hypothetical protein